MEYQLQQMSLAEFAHLQSEFGTKVVRQGGGYWRRVRPLFYRPVLATQERTGEILPPCRWPGGFQYVVREPSQANSTMNFVMLDDLRDYSLDAVLHKRRNLIKSAAKRFVVGPVRSLKELKEQGYEAFLSFYQRTGYGFRSDRTNRAVFETWANALFHQPKAILLGAYAGEKLIGVSCSYWVDRVLVYSTLFCQTEALKKNVGELLFHELRQLAAPERGIDSIFVRVYHGGNSLDQYYLLRGCKLVRKPARLELPRVTRVVMKSILPRQYAMIQGQV